MHKERKEGRREGVRKEEGTISILTLLLHMIICPVFLIPMFLENVDVSVFGSASFLTPLLIVYSFFFQVMRSVGLAVEAAIPLSSSSQAQRHQRLGQDVKTRPRL